MTKTGDTKQKILDLLAKKRMTLTDLSNTLNLAPSTVNQHIKELLVANAIKQVDNPYVVKWKYYEANPSFGGFETAKISPKTNISNPTFKFSDPLLKAISALIIIGIIIGALYGLGVWSGFNEGTGGIAAAISVSPGSTVFSISDSPTVAAITAVNVTVDSAMIHSATTGKWYVILNTPKTFNLVTLRNISSVLATANLSAGNYNEILLETPNATAVVNNQTIQVLLPSGVLRLFGNFNISGNTSSPSWINIDINLDKSLHFTGNGELIMLPVINLRTSNNANLSIASNGIIYVRQPGRIASQLNTSMDLNGTFNVNLISVPPSAQLGVGGNGKILILSNPNITNTITLRTGQMLIVITNVTNASAIVGNITAQAVPGPVIITGAGGRGNENGEINCTQQGPFTDCRVPDNVQVNTSAAGPCPLFCRWGAPCPMCPPPHTPSLNVTASEEVNMSNPSNLPPSVNSSYATCQTSSQCIVVTKAYCQNGLPQQSACINSQYVPQYSSWYNSTIGAGASTGMNSSIVPSSKGFGAVISASGSAHASVTAGPGQVCPMFIMEVPKYCGCASSVCTLYTGANTNS